MYIYLTNVLLIILECMVLLKNDLSKIYKKIFICLVSLQFILISGLRSLSLGADDIGYESSFYYYNTMSWKQALENLVSMFTSFGNYESRDMGYYIFTKLFSSICPSYRVFLFFVITVFMVGFSYYIYKYSNDYCMSYVIFASFLFTIYGMSVIRQALAVTICIFFGMKYVKTRNLFKFLLVMFVAFLFHQTILIFIPYYFIYDLKINTFYKIGLPIAFIAVLILNSQLVSIFLVGTYSKYGIVDSRPPYNLFFLVTMVVIVSIFFYEKLKLLNKNIHRYINAVVCGMFLLELSMVVPIFVRLAYNYILFIVFLIPELFNLFKERQALAIKILFYIVLIGLLIKTGATYKFLWQ